MTVGQHNGFTGTVTAAGTGEIITLADGGTLTGLTAVQSYTTADADTEITLTASQTGIVTGAAMTAGSNLTVNATSAQVLGATITGGADTDVLNITGGITAPTALAVTAIETLNISGASTAFTLTVTNTNTNLVNIDASGVTGGGITLDISGLTTGQGDTSITLTSGTDTLAASITGAGNNDLTIDFSTGNATVTDIAAGGIGDLLIQAAATAGSTSNITFLGATAQLEDFAQTTIDFDTNVTSFKTPGGTDNANQIIFLDGGAEVAANNATIDQILFDVDGNGAFGAGDIMLMGAGVGIDIIGANVGVSIVAGDLIIA
jgi:hypothetical protein